MSSTGEKTFNPGGRATHRFESTPLDPKPEYKFKLLGNSASVGKKEEPGKFPYVSVPLEVIGTAKKEGDKNRVIYHMFFTSLKPDKNGKLMADRADQFTGLFLAIGGNAPDIPVVNLPSGETNEDGELLTVRCLHAQKLKDWLVGMDGSTFKGKVKTQPAKDGYPAKSVVDFFIPAENQGAGNPDPFEDEQAGTSDKAPEPPPKLKK